MVLYLLLLQAVLATSVWAERITCYCNIGHSNCDSSNSCGFDEGNGVCITYYHRNTTLVQYCGQGSFTRLTCQANSGVYLADAAGTRGVCCFENFCNSQEALSDLYGTPTPSRNLTTTPPTVSTTTSLPTYTETTSAMPNSSPPSTEQSRDSDLSPPSTEQSTGSDSSPPVHAIVLSVVLPLMIIAVFAIAMVIFLMYMRLYIKHNREKSSSESEFSQIY